MRNLKTAVLAAVLLTLWTTDAVGIGKVTVDPNTPDKVVRPDTRVDQKVTYSAKRQFVWRILADLSKSSGVTLSAGYNDQDWQVRDRRMTVTVKDVPLRELMDSVARTMKFLWKAEGDPAKPSYRLYMDRRAVLLVEAEKARQANLIETMQSRARERLLNSIEYAAGSNQAEIEQLRERDPYTYVLAKSGIAAGIAQLFSACPDARKILASGERVKYVPSLSPEAAAALHKIGTGMAAYSDSPTGSHNQGTDNIANVLLNNFDGLDRQLIGQITIYYQNENQSQSELMLWDPTSAKAQIEGARVAALWDATPDEYQSINDEYDLRMKSIKPPDWAVLPADSVEPVAKHPDDSERERAIELALKDGTDYGHEDLAELLAEKCGANVVAESYVGGLPQASPGAVKMKSIRQLLDLMQDETQCNWWKRGSIIEIRSRHWYEARTWQIPEAWLERWRQTFKTTGTLDIDDLSSIANLTWDQLYFNVLQDEVLTNGEGHGADIAEIMQNSDVLLAAYGRLTRRQKAYMFSKRGLDVLSLPNRQKVLGELETGLDFSAVDKIIIGARKHAKGKAWEYRFDFATDEELPQELLRFTTPLYVEPKRKESSAAK